MKLFKSNIAFYGVGKRIIVGFAVVIFIFTISVLLITKIAKNSQEILEQLFEEQDYTVETIYEFRRISNLSKVSIIKLVYLPKDPEALQTLQKIQNKDFPEIKSRLLKNLKNWDNKDKINITLRDIQKFEENIKQQQEIMSLLPNFEAHNNPAAKFTSEDLLEFNILPTLNSINKNIENTLIWKKAEKEEARVLLESSYQDMIEILYSIGFIMTVLGLFATQFTASKIAIPLKLMKEQISKLSKGEIVNGVNYNEDDEIGEINQSIKKLIESFKYNTRFAESIGDGVFDINYEPLSDFDELGHSLIRMRTEIKSLIESLQTTQHQTQIAKNKAEEALVAKSQFLSVMSHEIRTPLNAIIGMSNLISDHNLNEEQKDQLQTIQFSSKNLLHLINEILDISKLDAGKVVLENNNFDLYKLLNNSIKLYDTIAKSKQLQIQFINNLNSQTNYKGDSYRLTQVFNNLINNAIKFTEKGQITVSANIINSTEKNDTILFSVKDTGIGIPSEKQSQIFESFSQANLNTTRIYGGTGLGLSICKKIVELMGSNITVNSTLGIGSEFSFEIVFEKTNESIIETLNQIEISKLVDKKFLIVEDNTINAKVLAGFFKKWAITNISFAINGQEAVIKTEENHYDCILMDLQMPIMDGYEATKQIRKFNKQIPIIALSAESHQDIKTLIVEFGFDDFVSKPFNPEELLSKIFNYIFNNDSIKYHRKISKISFYKHLELANNDKQFFISILTQINEDLRNFKLLLNDFKKNTDSINDINTAYLLHNNALKMMGLNDLCKQTEQLIIEKNSKIELIESILIEYTEVIHEIELKISQTKEQL